MHPFLSTIVNCDAFLYSRARFSTPLAGVHNFFSAGGEYFNTIKCWRGYFVSCTTFVCSSLLGVDSSHFFSTSAAGIVGSFILYYVDYYSIVVPKDTQYEDFHLPVHV